MGRRLTLEVDGTTRDLEITRGPDGTMLIALDGESYRVNVGTREAGGMQRVEVDERASDVHIVRAGRGVRVTVGPFAHEVVVHRGGAAPSSAFADGELAVRAPMSGVVTEVLVRAGEAVRQGDPLMVIVAMKMNNELRSPLDGVVRTVHAQVGETVDQGAVVCVLEAAEAS